MSGASFFAGAHNFNANNSTFVDANLTVSGMFAKYPSSKPTALDLWQVNIHGVRPTGVIPLMPNPSSRFTGRTEAIAKLKKHFLTNPDDVGQKRKVFLLYGMGGIGKTQICTKFVQEMSDR